MIEFCSKKRMVLAIAALAGLSVLIIILESSHLRSHQDDIHESHPLLKEKLKPADKCWTTENFETVEACETCTKEEIFGHNPLVCVARGNKEKVRCDSGKVAYRACDKVIRVEEQKFWIFEFVCAVSGALSASVVFLRQKQLDHKMYQKIQRQIAAGV